MHVALACELPHPGVDDRKTGATVLPGRERRLILPPAVTAIAIVLPRGLGPGRQELGVEVAPAELPDEGAGPGALARPLEDLERGEAAEVEIGTEPRGGVGREIVVQPAVLRDAVPEEAFEPPPPLALSTPRELGRARAGCDLGERGEPALAEPARQDDLPGRGLESSAGRRAPLPPVRSEDAVVIRARRCEVSGRDDRHPGQDAQLDPLLVADALEPLLARLGVRADVVADADRAAPVSIATRIVSATTWP